MKTGFAGDDDAFSRAMRDMLNILNSPSYKAVLEQQQRFLNSPEVRRSIEAATQAQAALVRVWTPQLQKLLADQARIIASLPLADIAKLARAATQLPPPPDVQQDSARQGLLAMYDAVAEEEFEHPLLTPENIETARSFIESAPEEATDSGTAPVPEEELSALENQVGDLVAKVAGQAQGPNLQKRAENVASVVSVLVLTGLFVAWALVPQLADKGMWFYHCIEIAKKVRGLAVTKYLELRSGKQPDNQDG